MKNKLLLTKSAILWVNEYYQMEGYILLKVFRKDLSESYDVLIDTEDFEKVTKGQWYVSIGRKNTNLKEIIKFLYTTHNPKKTYDIYQWFLDTKNKNIVVDHIDMNRLNNRRSNLRIATNQVNRINQEYKGYNYDKQTGRYLVRVSVTIGDKRKEVNMGRYKTEQEASSMYLKASIILGNDKISTHIAERIKEENIHITEEDYNNKYIQKIILLINGENVSKDLNGIYNLNYDKNIELIHKLYNDNYSYRGIANYLKENIEGLNNASGVVVKAKYEQYLKQLSI